MVDTDAKCRAELLVYDVGALNRMMKAALANGEADFALQLQAATDAALSAMRSLDAEMADGWRDVQAGADEDRARIAADLRALASSRFFTPACKATFAFAAEALHDPLLEDVQVDGSAA